MKNWKTTTLGILSIIGVAIHIGTVLLQGHTLTSQEMTADMTAIATGWGLIHASDATPKS
ncbi:MAG: hypothetical protein KGL39_59850 [Patescibacteria group bacterium]|nr:hypothetical protein [Patescibacteria group bacterium]